MANEKFSTEQPQQGVATHHDFLSPISKNDLKRIGMGEVAYVKKYLIDGKPAFVLHAADGTALAVQGNNVAAKNSAHQQELELVAIH